MKHTEMSRSGRIQVPVLPQQQQETWLQQLVTVLRAWFGRRSAR